MGLEKTSEDTPIPPSYLSHLVQLIRNNQKTHISWLKCRKGFIVKDSQSLKQSLSNIFHMQYKSFKIYSKLIGFQVKKTTKGQLYRHSKLKIDDYNYQYHHSEQGQKNMKEKHHLQDISLEINLKQQKYFEYIENSKKVRDSLMEAQFRKQQLIQVYRARYERCDKLIDNVIYNLLISYKKQEINEQQILNQITQIQDLFGENQRELKNCILFLAKQSTYQQKISNNQVSQQKNQNDHPTLKFKTVSAIPAQPPSK